MDLGLKNKVAFVAAASDGLGKSVAIELAKEGADIIICGRNSEKLAGAHREIQDSGSGKVISISGDL